MIANKKNLKPKQEQSCEDEENEDLLYDTIKAFPKLSPTRRHEFLLSILKESDPNDMDYIFKCLPRLHRDFFTLLPAHISYKIILFIHPKDINVIARVSRKWNTLTKALDLWKALYSNIGLSTMFNYYFDASVPLNENTRKLLTLGNWVKGHFRCITVRAHPLGILAISMFGSKWIATASADKSVKLFDIKTGSSIMSYLGHEFPVTCVYLDELKVVSGSSDGTVRVWDREKGTCKTILRGHSKGITCLKLLPQIDTIVTGSMDRSLKVWIIENNVLFKVFGASTVKKNKAPNMSVQKTETVSCDRTLFGHGGAVKCLDASNEIIISGDTTGFLKIWHLQSGNCLKTINTNLLFNNQKLPNDLFNEMLDANVNLDASESEAIKNSGTKTPSIQKIKNVVDPISNITFNDSRLAFSNFSGAIYLYKIQQKNQKNTIQHHNSMKIGQNFEEIKSWVNSPSTFKFLQKYNLENDNSQFVDARLSAAAAAELLKKREDQPASKVEYNRRKTFASELEDEEVMASTKQRHTWAICLKMDAWRLMCGGMSDKQAKCILWNHREDTKIYSLNGGTIQSSEVKEKFNNKTKEEGEEAVDNGTKKAITGVAFDDRYIAACGMDGNLRIWDSVSTE